MDENLHLLDRPTAARMLGVSLETVKTMIEAGTLEAVQLHPKAWPRVRRADVEALARGEQPARKAASP
jgi:excisionase family DNA binding protein